MRPIANEPEVEELHAAAAREEDVAGYHVAVNDAAPMQVGERARKRAFALTMQSHARFVEPSSANAPRLDAKQEPGENATMGGLFSQSTSAKLKANLWMLLFGVAVAALGYVKFHVTQPARVVYLLGIRPLKCGGDQVVHVRGKQVRADERWFDNPQDGTITALGRCHVIIENTKLAAESPIVAADHAIVTVRGSEIACVGFGDCISAAGDAKVELDHSTIRASVGARPCTTCDTAKEQSFGSGISLSQRATLVMTGGLVDAGGGTAVDARDDVRIELHDATLRTKLVVDKWGHAPPDAYDFELRDRARVEIFGGELEVEASMCPIWIDTDAKVAVHETKIVGEACRFHRPENVTGL